MIDKPYGYYVGSVYKGTMPDGRQLPFPTEGEYVELFNEESTDFETELKSAMERIA